VNCRDLSEFLQEYLAGELPSRVADEFAGHLSSCDNCEVFLEQYRQTILLGRAVIIEGDTGEVPEELVRAIIAAVEAGR
jgi:anti-sigma factor RsiW